MSDRRRRTIAIIQAGLGAPQDPLPGRSLGTLAQKLRRSRLIDDVVVATSTAGRDDAVVTSANASGLHVVRGVEDDVLGCFARAAEAFDADIVVRIACDAPFIDTEHIDRLVTALLDQDADYVLPEKDAAPVESFSRRALDKLMMDARFDAVARRHVTAYFALHPQFARPAHVSPPAVAGDNFRPDGAADRVAIVERAHARLAAKDGEASLDDLLALLGSAASRSEGRSRTGVKPRGAALIRCDGGGPFGQGRVRRMVLLARTLLDEHGLVSHFAVNGPEEALQSIRSAGFEAQTIDRLNEVHELSALIAVRAPLLFVLDGREGPTVLELKRLKRGVPLTATIDDETTRRLVADVAYYPPLPHNICLDWRAAQTAVRIGWEWSLSGAQPAVARPRGLSPRPTLLVMMGSGDSFALTLRAAKALSGLPPVFRARFVIGGATERERVARAIVTLKSGFETIEGADDLSTEYASADAALTVFDERASELAAAGVPAIYLVEREADADSASAFEHAGMGLSLGYASGVRDETIAQTVQHLLTDSNRRRDMRAAGLMNLDGNGARRIAADLAQRLAEQQSAPAAADFG